MPPGRDQFRSSFGAFKVRERELERSRARHDVSDPASRESAADAEGSTPHPAAPPRVGD
jgi:hypothetical protein